jgi:excisionase family DNA binding protein
MPKNVAVSAAGEFPELIDVKTLARLLAVNERYVRRMIQQRRLPTIKVGRLVRFDLADVREWIQRQRRATRPERYRLDEQ